MTRTRFVAAMAIFPLLIACVPASEHAANVGGGPAGQDRLTVGTVQREIRVGMTTADVAAVLGAPNIVSTDERRREVWVYDRIASQQVYSTSAVGASVLVVGAGAASGARQTSQRTLTVIIRFDEAQRVRDFSYRSSSF
ncbi:MAG: outer membrane protein assembly factor BamE [Acetobacteraceae bacterium]|nr:outer membrane protein assembly factor BamE [Acetobacteraceae bacterium]